MTHVTAADLAALPALAGADPAALLRAAPGAAWREFETGATVLDYDCPSTEVRFVVRGGPLRVLMRTSGGREKIVAEIGPGGFVGEQAAIAGPAEAPSAGIVALHRVRLCILPGESFMDIVLASPPVARRLMVMLTERVRSGNRRLLEYAALPVRQRLLSELLRLARPRTGGEGLAISPPPVRGELAARIGARREAVSREMAALARAGLLEVGPRAVVLRDPGAIRREVAAGMEAAGRWG